MSRAYVGNGLSERVNWSDTGMVYDRNSADGGNLGSPVLSVIRIAARRLTGFFRGAERTSPAELLHAARVLMLTASNEQDAIVRSIAAGATGYLQKYSGKEQLLTTLREVARGEFRIPGSATRRLSRAVRSPSADAAAELLATLTDRERQILKLFAEGLTYQEIGEIRNNSGLTVRNAVSGVQRKLGFKTRQQMVVWAVRVGLVDGGSP